MKGATRLEHGLAKRTLTAALVARNLISKGFKVSINLRLDMVKGRAYNYSYDAMNRSLAASQKQKTATWGAGKTRFAVLC